MINKIIVIIIVLLIEHPENYLNDNNKLSTAHNSKVHITARVSRNNSFSVYYQDDATGYSESKRVSSFVKGANSFQVIELNIQSKYDISKFRVDFEGNVGDTIILREIWFSNDVSERAWRSFEIIESFGKNRWLTWNISNENDIIFITNDFEGSYDPYIYLLTSLQQVKSNSFLIINAKVLKSDLFSVYYNEASSNDFPYSDTKKINKFVSANHKLQEILINIPDTIEIRRLRIDFGHLDRQLHLKEVRLSSNGKEKKWTNQEIYDNFYLFDVKKLSSKDIIISNLENKTSNPFIYSKSNIIFDSEQIRIKLLIFLLIILATILLFMANKFFVGKQFRNIYLYNYNS